MYTYKSIFFGKTSAMDASITKEDNITLNKLFDEGWEYVDSINQPLTGSGQSSYARFSNVIIILRKNKPVTL